MKKIFLFALAALSLVACKKDADEPTSSVALTLNESAITIKVNETHLLIATVAPEGTPVAWKSDDPSVAAVNADGMVVGISEGTTYVRAKAADVEKYCIVTVSNGGGGDVPSGAAGKLVDCVKIWPVVFDETSAGTYASKIVSDFRPNDVDRFLYVWTNGETYASNPNPTGKNFFQTESNGGYLSMNVAEGQTWAGMGYFVSKDAIAPVNELINKIKANPSNFGFHMAFKSTDNYSHYFAILGAGDAGLKWAIGDKQDAPKHITVPRTGAWQSVVIEFKDYAAIINEIQTKTDDGMNIFYMGSEGVPGAQLNLDACYFYQIKDE